MLNFVNIVFYYKQISAFSKMMSGYIEEPLFDIPFCRVEEAYLPSTNPWIEKHTQSNSTGVITKADILCSGKIKKRDKYTSKLEKQLLSVGIKVTEDFKIGDVLNSSSNVASDNSSTDIEVPPSKTALETLDANTIIKSIMTDEDEFNDWDPMKISYEQKHFNSYKEQKYDDNPVERHSPIKKSDGSEQISPTKCGVEDVRLYIYNIPLSMTEEGLANLFSSVGDCYNVKKSKSINEKNTTYGFVSYRNVRDAEAAISKFNGFVFGGKYTLGVKLSVGRNNQSTNKEKIIWGDSSLDALSSSESHDQDVSENSTVSATAEIIKSENTRLFIHGLKVSMNNNDLQKLFEDIGPVHDVVIVPPKKPNQYSTYGFVTLESVEAANLAIQMLHNSMYEGNKLTVSSANKGVSSTAKSVSPAPKSVLPASKSVSPAPKSVLPVFKSVKVNKNEDEIFYDNLYNDSVWGCDYKEQKEDVKLKVPTSNVSLYHQNDTQLDAPDKLLHRENKKMNRTDTVHPMVMLSELKINPFPDLNEFEVCFTEVVSPMLMYAQMLDNITIDALQQVTLRLEEIDEDFPLLTPKVDQICCAKYSADNQWYRASVIRYNTDFMATVNFIDFGNKADVDISSIRCIDKQLLSYPILASMFSLEGIESTSEDGVWGNDVVEFMALSLLNQAIKVKCLRISNNIMTCEIELPDGNFLSQKLVAKGLAKRKCLEEISQKQTLSKITIPNNTHEMFQRYTEKDITFYSPSNSNIDLLITYVKSPSLFYGRIADIALNETVANISIELFEIYSNSSSNGNYNPVEGDVCAGFYAEYGEWYRILVLVAYTDTVVAFLIDYGDVVIIPFDGLRLLPLSYISLPSQAIALRLYNIEPIVSFQCIEENEADTWSSEAIEIFKDMVLFKKVSVEIVSEVDISNEKATNISHRYFKTFNNVHMKIIDTDVASVLLTRNLACRKEKKSITQNIIQDSSKNSKCIPKRVMVDDLPQKDFPNKTFSLLIVNADSPSKFHGQMANIDLIQDLDFMSQDMTSYYSKDISEYVPIVGEVCAVFFLAYEQYFRARIDHIGKSEIKVTSIDFGNTQTVTLGDIKPLPLKYSSTPCQAYHLSLYSIAELNSKSWSEECCKFFMECCINSKVDVTIKEKINDVCFVDMSSNSISSFSKLLIDNGYATYKDQIHKSESSLACDASDKTIKIEIIESSLVQNNIIENPFKKYEPSKVLSDKTNETLQLKESLNKRLIDPYTNLPLFDLPAKFEILVCHVESLDCFYSQVCDNALLTKNYEMQLEMYEYCQSSEIKSYLPKYGELCLGFLDEAWYRVYVKLVSKSSANVLFIDYGNCCDLSFSMLRPFNDAFLKFPSLAIPMKLNNPKNVKSYAGVIEEFRNRTENRRCSAAVKSISNEGFVEVDITDDSLIDVMSVLILAEESKASLSEITDATEKASETLNDDQMSVFDILSKPDESLFKNFNSINAPIESTVTIVNNVVQKSRDSKVTKGTFTVSNLPPREHPLESVSFKIQISSLPISNKAVIISITHVESPYLTYGVTLESLDIIRSLSEKISCLVDETNETIHLKAGTLCCVQKEDGKWVRCITCSVNNDNAVVFCIDYGFTLVVNHNCIRPFFNDLKSYAAQVIPIKLMLVKPSNGELGWSDSAILKYKNIVSNQNVKVISKKLQGVISNVKMRLINENESVETLMESIGIATLNPFATEAETSSGEFVKKEVIPFSDISKKVMFEDMPKDEFKAIVICSVSPRIFYVQIFDDEKIAKVDDISVKLQDLYDNDESDFEFYSGQLCSVKYHDQLWYRGYLISISDDFVVYLIDYGIKANFKRKHIKPLPEEFQKYPAQALIMQMNNIIPSRSSDSFSRDAKHAFRSLTEGRLVRIRHIISIGYIHRVDIIDDISNNNIGLQLVQKGFAEYKNIAQVRSMKSPENRQLSYGTLRDMRHNVAKPIEQSNQSSYQNGCTHYDGYCVEKTLHRENHTYSGPPLVRRVFAKEVDNLQSPIKRCEEKYSLSNGTGNVYNYANGVA